MIVSMAIANRDEPELNRKKEGDIIAVRPQDWKWGTLEVKHFLIIEVDLGSNITTLDEAQRLKIPYFETGELVEPMKEDFDDTEYKIIGKRRYKLPFARIGDKGIDFDRVRDPDDEYQPIEKDVLQVVGMVEDKFKERALTEADIIEIKNADPKG